MVVNNILESLFIQILLNINPFLSTLTTFPPPEALGEERT